MHNYAVKLCLRYSTELANEYGQKMVPLVLVDDIH